MMTEEEEKDKTLERIDLDLKPEFIRKHPGAAEKIFNRLLPKEQLKLALARRGRERMELILLSHKDKALVRSLPAQELYLTLKEIGEEEALPLLALASHQQLTYIFDLEFWDKDVLSPARVIKWLELLRMASQDQLQSWLKRADPELLVLALQKLVQVFVADPDNLGAEEWRNYEDIFTLDELYYFKPLDKKNRNIIEKTLIYLRDIDAEQFYTLMDSVRMELPLELEDTAYRVREGRLEDYGFYSFDDAFEIYRYLSPEKMKELQENPEKPFPPKTPVVRYPVMLGQDVPSLLRGCLSQMTSLELEDFYHQFAMLANKVMVADSMDLTELENVKRAVEKVYGYLEIGLSSWSKGNLEDAKGLLQKQWLQYIFQAGFSQVLRLRFRAQRICEQNWFKSLGKRFSLFGEVDGRRIEALIQGRPKFYSEEKAFELREFRSMKDIWLAEKSVAKAELCAKLFFEILGLDEIKLKKLCSIYPFELNFQVILAGLLVSGVVRAKPDFEPIREEELSEFINKAMSPGIPRKIDLGLKDEFLKWMRSKMKDAGMDDEDSLREFLEAAIKNLESELGRLKEVKRIERKMISSVVMAEERRIKISHKKERENEEP